MRKRLAKDGAKRGHYQSARESVKPTIYIFHS